MGALKARLSASNADRAIIVAKLLWAYKGKYGDACLDLAKGVFYERGLIIGGKVARAIEESGRDANDLRVLRETLRRVLGTTVGSDDILMKKRRLEYRIKYCPWIDTWTKAGYSIKIQSILCDVVSQTDLGVVAKINPQIKWKCDKGLSRGKPYCSVSWELPEI